MPWRFACIHALIGYATFSRASEKSCSPPLPAIAESNLLQLHLRSAEKATSSATSALTYAERPDVTTSIRYSGNADRISNPKAALYTTLVKPFGTQHWKGNDMLLDSLFLYCSARWAGSQLPFHITTSGISSQGLQLLKDLGFQVHDFTALEDHVRQQWYKPVYTKQQALEQGRLWIDPVAVSRYGVDGEHALNRTDGWATYFKFLAWNNTVFDVLLHVDVDVQFLGSPDAFIREAAQRGEVFLANVEDGGRQYTGLNTHMMLLRPSPEVFDALVRKASLGDYVPLTNTEQDVLEWYFDTVSVTRPEMVEGVLHEHNDESSAAWTKWLSSSEVPTQCTAASLVEGDFGKMGLTCQRLEEACHINATKRQMYMHPPQASTQACPARIKPFTASRRPRVFVIVPGFGEIERREQLQTNMAWLREQDVDIVCTIYVYALAEKLPIGEEEFSPCKIHRQSGYPAEFMVMPVEEEWSEQDYVLMWFDDVALPPDTDLRRMITILDYNGLGMLTPSFSAEMYAHSPERHGSIMFHNSSRQFPVGRRTSYAELLFSLMTPDSYRCLRSLVDLKVNPFGYGLDRLFPDRCSEHCLGVLDETTMLDTSAGSFSYAAADDYQDAYFSKHGFPSDREIVFGSLEDPYTYTNLATHNS